MGLSGNYVVAIIILVLFTVLGLVGFFIWYANTGFSRMGARAKGDLEEGSSSSGSSRRSGRR
jgi:hypothetical protein